MPSANARCLVRSQALGTAQAHLATLPLICQLHGHHAIEVWGWFRADTMAAMDNYLITVDGAEHEVRAGNLKRLLDSSTCFWLDPTGLDQAAVALLQDTIGFIRWRSTPSTSGSARSSTAMTTSR